MEYTIIKLILVILMVYGVIRKLKLIIIISAILFAFFLIQGQLNLDIMQNYNLNTLLQQFNLTL